MTPDVPDPTLGHLPPGRPARLDRRLGPAGPALAMELAEALGAVLGGELILDRFGAQWRAAGLGRPGSVAQLAWPRQGSRVALGVDPPLAHALVDRLLGFERSLGESRLQVTPVEWGLLAFLVARGLDWLDGRPGPLGPWDLLIDRVGPDPFDSAGLGPVVTYRWRARLGTTVGSIRLWLPESLLAAWLDEGPRSGSAEVGIDAPEFLGLDWGRLADLATEWRAEAGVVTVPTARWPGWLRPSKLVLLDGAPLGGTPTSPAGVVTLAQPGPDPRARIACRVEPGPAGARLVVEEPLGNRPASRVPAADDSRPDSTVALVVELGRVALLLRRVAELRPGDVVELDRPAGGSVDLTTAGRLVARGELVQVDTELGVRITQVYP